MKFIDGNELDVAILIIEVGAMIVFWKYAFRILTYFGIIAV